MNFIPCHLVKAGDDQQLQLSNGIAMPVPGEYSERYMPYVGKDVILGIRPEYFGFDDDDHISTEALGKIEPTIYVIEPLGSSTLYFFEIDGTEIVACLQPLLDFRPGDVLPLTIDMRKMHLFDPSTEKII